MMIVMDSDEFALDMNLFPVTVKGRKLWPEVLSNSGLSLVALSPNRGNKSTGLSSCLDISAVCNH